MLPTLNIHTIHINIQFCEMKFVFIFYGSGGGGVVVMLLL